MPCARIADPQAAINRCVAEADRDPRPFVSTADPNDIIRKVRRGKQALAEFTGQG
jgi:hypothetical protein